MWLESQGVPLSLLSVSLPMGLAPHLGSIVFKSLSMNLSSSVSILTFHHSVGCSSSSLVLFSAKKFVYAVCLALRH